MSKVRFLGLDGLRGVCALSVVLYHCELLFKPGVVFCHGFLAVDMFFLLSGFVIAASYDARLAGDLSAGQFLVLRLRRLAPVYWAGLLLCIAGGLLTSRYVSAPGPVQVLKSGLMAAVLIPQTDPGNFAYPVNPVAWTLAWELVVNVLYAKWMRRCSTLVLGVSITLSFALALAEAQVNPRGWSFGMTGQDIWLGGLRTFPEFLAGVLLFRAFRAGRLDRLPTVTPFLPLIAWLAVAELPQSVPPMVDGLIVALLCPLLIAALLRCPAPAWFAGLGAISYPLYASHLAFVSLARETPLAGLYRHADPVRASGVVLVALAMAWAIHRLIERKGGISGFSGLSGSEKAPSGACLGSPDPV